MFWNRLIEKQTDWPRANAYPYFDRICFRIYDCTKFFCFIKRRALWHNLFYFHIFFLVSSVVRFIIIFLGIWWGLTGLNNEEKCSVIEGLNLSRWFFVSFEQVFLQCLFGSFQLCKGKNFPIFFFKNSLQYVNGHNECQKILQLLTTNPLKNRYDIIQTFLFLHKNACTKGWFCFLFNEHTISDTWSQCSML